MKKNLFLFLLSFIMIVPLFSFSAHAQSIVSTGKCGPSVTYTIFSDGKMVLEGTGTARQSNFDKNITSLVVSEGITALGNYIFSSCENLKTVSLPKSLKSIGDMAFSSSGIEKITIPENTSNLGTSVFSGCSSLKEFTVEKENANLSSEKGILFNKDKSLLIAYPAKRTTAFSIPSHVKEIGECAFYGCSLTEISIPSNVEKIGTEAFARSNLKSITIPETIKEISPKAFESCAYLKTARIQSKSLGDFAFYNCQALENAFIEGVNYIGKYAFSECDQLKNVFFSEELLTIDSFAFYNCDSLEKIRIPKSTILLGERAFSNCEKLLCFIVCNKNLALGEKAFGFSDNLRIRDTVVYGEHGSSAEEYSKNTFLFVNNDINTPIFADSEIYEKDGVIYGIKEKTSPSFSGLIFANKDVSSSAERYIGTGTKIFFGSESFQVAVWGDTDGSGVVDSTDYLLIKSVFLKTHTLDEIHSIAADTDGSGIVDSTDYLKIKSYFLS